MQEKTYYTNGKVTVTNSRLILPNQTYAISGITSVQLDTVKPRRILPVLLMALCVAVAHEPIWMIAISLIPGLLWLIMQKTRYTITISNASGREKALTSKYPNFVRGVVNAINEAIIERG